MSALAITTATPLPGGSVGIPYGPTIAATGGTAPYTWSISAGALPAGVGIIPSSGKLVGTPTTAGTASFTVSVTDSAGSPATVTKAFTAVIASAPGPAVVQSVKEIFTADPNTISMECSKTNIVRKFVVTISKPDASYLWRSWYASDPVTSVTIPAIGSLLFVGGLFYVSGYRTQWYTFSGGKQSGTALLVEPIYTVVNQGNVVNPTVAPWNRPVYIDSEITLQMEDSEQDAEALAVVNSAQVPFADPFRMLKPKKQLICSYARLASAWDGPAAKAEIGLVNDEQITIGPDADGHNYTIAKNCGRVLRVSDPQEVWTDPANPAQQTTYHKITVTIEYVDENTNLAPAEGTIIDNDYEVTNGTDMGLRYIAKLNNGTVQVNEDADSNKPYTPCKVWDYKEYDSATGEGKAGTEFARPAPHPMALDVDGKQIKQGVDDGILTAADLCWQIYSVATPSDWSGLLTT